MRESIRREQAGPRRRRRGPARGLGLALLLTLTPLAVAGCAEEAPPEAPPVAPVFQEGSAALTCQPDADDASFEVLVGGEVTVVDDNLVAVRALVAGVAETVALSGDPLPEPVEGEEEDEAPDPQRWSFSLDPTLRVVCNDQLQVTFTAHDADDEQASQSVVFSAP